VVFDGSDAAQRALQVALQIAPNEVIPVTVILTASNPDHLSTLAEQTSRLAGNRSLQLVKMVNPAWRDVIEQAHARHAAALVVAITAELLEQENLERLRNQLNCPVVLVK
jgi:nucleotide-binding universal stress UspA family protein